VKSVIYVRVSSPEQAKRGTPESQLKDLPEWCARQGWEIVDTFVEDGGVSGEAELAQRESLMRMLARVEQGGVDQVVLWDLDRLTRDRFLDTRGQILGRLQRAGVRVAEYTTGAVHDLDSPTGQLMATLRAQLAAEENAKRRQRVIAGKARSIAHGRKPAGRTPYGLVFDRSSGAFSIDSETGPVVREIYARVLAGESCYSIAVSLHKRGLRYHGHEWKRKSVWRVARSEYVTGRWVVDKAASAAIEVPQLVALDVWRDVQRKLARATTAPRTSQRVYLAQGIGTCVLCGGRIRVLSDSKRSRRYHQYYVCSNRLEPRMESERCTLPNRRVDEVDERLWRAVVAFFGDEQWPVHREEMRLAAAEVISAQGELEHAVHVARLELARLDGVQDTLLGIYRRGLVTSEGLERELATLDQERARARQALASAEGRLGHAGLDFDAMERIVEAVRDVLPAAPPEIRRQLVMELIPGTGDFRLRFGPDGQLDARIVVPSSLAFPSACRSRPAR
jgi:DNA invertase Pin-like site-specific DNA recombinase